MNTSLNPISSNEYSFGTEYWIGNEGISEYSVCSIEPY